MSVWMLDEFLLGAGLLGLRRGQLTGQSRVLGLRDVELAPGRGERVPSDRELGVDCVERLDGGDHGRAGLGQVAAHLGHLGLDLGLLLRRVVGLRDRDQTDEQRERGGCREQAVTAHAESPSTYLRSRARGTRSS